MPAALSPAIQVGDFVTFGGRAMDLWQVISVRHGAARVAPRSVHLAGRPSRSVPIAELTLYSLSGSVDEF